MSEPAAAPLNVDDSFDGNDGAPSAEKPRSSGGPQAVGNTPDIAPGEGLRKIHRLSHDELSGHDYNCTG